MQQSSKEEIVSEMTMKMDRSAKLLPLIPMGFATSFLLSFISLNMGRFRGVWLLRPMAIILGGGALLSLLIFRLIRNRQFATVVSTMMIIFTLHAGNLSETIGIIRVTINPMKLAANPLGNTVIEIIILVIPPAVIALALFLLSLRPRFLKPVVTTLTVLLISSFIISFIPIIEYSLKHSEQGNNSHLLPADALTELSVGRPTRDIYFIVVDSYAEKEILDAHYGFDNSEFLEFLKARGFFVGKGSQSNYVFTRHSLSSTLNLDYVQSIVGEIEYDEGRYANLIRKSRTRQILEEMGYQTIAFETGFATTDVFDAAIYLRAMEACCNPIETSLLRQTMWRYMLSVSGIHEEAVYLASYEPHIRRVLNMFDNLGSVAELEGAKFVFAHILIPHPPFVFGPEGQLSIPPYPFALNIGMDYPGNIAQYKQGYIDQVRYVNAELMGIIVDIQEKSTEPPIIIIQGDHGPSAKFGWSSPTPENLKEGFSILNAMYLPEIDPADLYEDVSPINTFRIVLNNYFGADFPYLPDLHFYPGDDPDDLSRLRQADP